MSLVFHLLYGCANRRILVVVAYSIDISSCSTLIDHRGVYFTLARQKTRVFVILWVRRARG